MLVENLDAHVEVFRITVNDFKFQPGFIRGERHNASLGEGKRIIVDGQAAYGDIAAVLNRQRLCGFRADHFDILGDDRDILEVAQSHMALALWFDAIAARRDHDAFLSSGERLIDEPLQIKGNPRPVENRAAGFMCDQMTTTEEKRNGQDAC